MFMPASRESLDFKERSESESAPFLFSQSTIDALTEAERRGDYTLERLRQLRPEAIDEIIRLRGEHCGQLRIAKICRVHHRTVAAVCAQYPEEIGMEQQKRVKRLRSAADKLVELVDEDPESVPANVRCLAASQLLDKAQLLDGQATVRIEEVERIDIYEHWKKFLAGEVEGFAGGWIPKVEAETPPNSIDIGGVNALGETGGGAQKTLAIRDAEETGCT
jgi:hypothetical protein